MMKTILLFATLSSLAFAGDWIPRGTNLLIRTDENIHIRANEGDGRIYRGYVDRDVFDRDGAVVVPKGANAELIVRRISRDEVAVDLDSITVDGHRYGIAATEAAAEGNRTENKGHVGAFAGGGAVLGTILGAVAGGGKGAVIGAIAGAGAGAATGLTTRGSSLNVPVESRLTFRLEQPIHIDEPDHGVDRDGHHYHDRDHDRQ